MNILITPKAKRLQTIEEYINKYLPKYGNAPKTANEAAETFVRNWKGLERTAISTTNGRIIWEGETFEILRVGGGEFKVRKL